ncbi:hypothetical protein [Gracilibacillus salinarum]|uniref:Uncharacterized protein n=1 Tax=Gracilibacillus salinarum TaxID=2932255 RepID=A0ABY4GQV4_9BACI|nr:hypothetical protein [Gracilibacillus salinarum]UOQ86523.1 hypothetical protein MUN87_06450 [Gracilibacillus salinarum]
MVYVFIFLIGFGFSISGGISIILYLNFIPAGLSFIDYLSIVQTKMECYFLIVGIILMGFSLQKISMFSVK